MKQTSLTANRNATKSGLKDSHKKKILKALKGKMTGKQIAIKSGLDYHAVMRRMSELEEDLKVTMDGIKNGFTVYRKII